jgi:protein-S-isoprenylcysteine O-methyltransferase Ste14
VSRGLVGAVFALFTVGMIGPAVEAAERAVAEGSLRGWLVMWFWVLKVAVVAAFAYFVMSRPASKRRAREPLAFAACAAALVAAAALRSPDASASTTALLAGDALAVVSCIWLLASVLALGRCFGILPEARGLVTRGPYRFVRHPVYLGELAACCGLVLGAPTAWNLTAAGVMLVAQLVRMRLEESALEGAFPEYGAYAARTPRILPWPMRWRAARPATAPHARVSPSHPSPLPSDSRA